MKLLVAIDTLSKCAISILVSGGNIARAFLNSILSFEFDEEAVLPELSFEQISSHTNISKLVDMPAALS